MAVEWSSSDGHVGLLEKKDNISCERGTARRSASVEILSTATQLYKITLQKVRNMCITLKGHWKWWNVVDHIIYHSVSVVCSYNIAVLHHFKDINTFYSAGDLEKSFRFDTTVEITGFPICM